MLAALWHWTFEMQADWLILDARLLMQPIFLSVRMANLRRRDNGRLMRASIIGNFILFNHQKHLLTKRY
jgi:hypothetical protein